MYMSHMRRNGDLKHGIARGWRYIVSRRAVGGRRIGQRRNRRKLVLQQQQEPGKYFRVACTVGAMR
jgi:hypothetical protein